MRGKLWLYRETIHPTCIAACGWFFRSLRYGSYGIRLSAEASPQGDLSREASPQEDLSAEALA
jgi:hypothetical protein